MSENKKRRRGWKVAIELNEVIPLGRSLREYRAMFGLTEDELRSRILDCGGGPSSFNDEVSRNGGHVVSVDPLYQFSADQVRKQMEDTFEGMMQQIENNQDRFVWHSIESVKDLRTIRQDAMKMFLNDFEKGKVDGRYLDQELPALEFDSETFDLALSSHFLFLYSHILTYGFHRKAIAEMLRVAKEVRIFPLVDLNASKSEYIPQVIKEFSKLGYSVDIVKVDYEFQKGANEYMRIRRG